LQTAALTTSPCGHGGSEKRLPEKNGVVKSKDFSCVKYNYPMEKEERLGLKKIWDMTRPSFKGTAWRYLVIIVFLAVASLGSIAEPLLYGRVVDTVVHAVGSGTLSSLWSALVPLLGMWVVIDVVSSASREIANVITWKAANKVWARFWRETLRRVLSWEPQRFTTMPMGALAKQLDNAGNATWRLSGDTIQKVFPIFFGATAFFVVGIFLDWRMTLASLAGVPLLFLMSFVAERRVEKRQDAMNESWEAFLQKLIEIFSNIVPVKSFAAEERMASLHMEMGEDAMARQQRVSNLWAVLGFSTSFARFFGRFVLLGTGLYFISQGTLSLGTLITFMGMLDIVLAPFEHLLADVMRKVSETRSSFARVYRNLETPNDIQEKDRPESLKRVRGEIVVKDLSYRYPEKKEYALKNISLTVPAGSSLALVGPSGSGKSTLVRFLNRFLDPTEGSVTLDGKDLKDVRLNELRRAVGFVHQESVLFNASILENIKFAKPNATKAEVIEACKQAQAHEFIERLVSAYDTVVGERGIKLSGGERQRLAIARVFLANQPILVLDESTSALDSETEHKLQAALRKAMEGRTTILIAHRLSTIYMADVIAVMEQGKIVEMGTHKELLQEGGLYERLWKMQSGGYFDE
jgi:ABC-type multidrug transport system fused ATPase/permease subunit